MAVDERARHELRERLVDALGREAAVTLIEEIAPLGRGELATKRDLDQLERRLDARFVAVEHRLDGLEHRLDALVQTLDHRFEALDHRFEALDHRFEALDHRFEATEGRLLAAFRQELVVAVSSQTRAMIFTMAGTVLSLGGLALALARLG